jgi:LysM repeat protein
LTLINLSPHSVYTGDLLSRLIIDLYRPRVFISFLTVVFAFGAISVSLNARADDIEDLLRETNRALGHGTGAEKARDSDKIHESENAVKPNKKKPTVKTPDPSNLELSSQPGASSKPSEAATKSVLTPTDAESVNELINVGLRRQAQLRPDQKEELLEVAFGVARLHGTHELTKDDDTFRVQKGEKLSGVALSYSVDVGTRAWSVGKLSAVRPLARLGAGFLKGRVAVDRSGVENTRIDPDYNLIPVNAGLGLRNSSSRHWRLSAAYGPAIEMLVQTGEGNSDSTSGMFFSDALDVSAEKSVTENFWLGVTWQARGLMPFTGDEAGHHLLAITLNTPLAG